MAPGKTYFHLHLISDSTGETLLTVGRAVSARYENIAPIEHVYPLVRTSRHLERVIQDIEAAPGIVLYTIVERELSERLERACRAASLPCVSVLEPVVDVFRRTLNLPINDRVGGQHALDAGYFARIDALDFSLTHDDGQLPADLETADIIIIGVSRSSKTPTSMYLAIKGLRVTNLPLVPGVPLPEALKTVKRPLVVGLVASAERIQHIRQNRVLSFNPTDHATDYVDRAAIVQEIAMSRRICLENSWPMIDVTRRSIEETAAAILALYSQHRYGKDRLPYDV